MNKPVDKARAQRLQRFDGMLGKLENPPAALDILVTELQAGDDQQERWEKLHAAACNGQEQVLAAAYTNLTSERRMKPLTPGIQAALLNHAANYLQGVLGDVEKAEVFLLRALELAPNQTAIFTRLERKFMTTNDSPRLAELYAVVASNAGSGAGELATKAVKIIVPLTAKTPLSDKACRGLLALLAVAPSLLDVLEQHCRKTGRPKLACELIEKALEMGTPSGAGAVEPMRRLIALYLGEADQPAKAIAHVEELLRRDPSDPQAKTWAERLLSNREVTARAAAALQEVRRFSRRP